MHKIIWTKIYDLNHIEGFYSLYISAADTGFFFGGVMYYTRTGQWGKDTLSLTTKLEQFIGSSEEDVYRQCTNWIDENLPGHYEPVIREEKTFE